MNPDAGLDNLLNTSLIMLGIFLLMVSLSMLDSPKKKFDFLLVVIAITGLGSIAGLCLESGHLNDHKAIEWAVGNVLWSIGSGLFFFSLFMRFFLKHVIYPS
jgi:fluoride ion exporter CrcB/FEX